MKTHNQSFGTQPPVPGHRPAEYGISDLRAQDTNYDAELPIFAASGLLSRLRVSMRVSA
jgi:hypothetical protein